MIHEKNDLFPYGMTEDEAKLLMTSEDVYEVLETFDSLEDALSFIKETYGIKAYEYAKEDSEQSINEENEFIKYRHNNGDTNYITYASFDISDNIENYRKGKRYEPSFFWFPSGKIVRVKLY
ncbi:TPA: hypothetical protein PTV74_003122 [Clostridium botulinum]|nr:hypothetical protein [Clostridium botulinum]HDK7206277.1 hypothetical protein [Clostridium botulinum]HDK7210013.1 hypothetical protein [Clostridium botulinum]HDK7265462.1 hypothetical protein [Clostridium botulinum]HDK7269310.1 hypothetical protein [Clostridium botulinum]